jgi:hypothetical protein
MYINFRKKGNVVPLHAMKAWESIGIASLVINLHARWR